MSRPAVFLDRDGTIIVEKVYLSDPAGVELIPGAVEGLHRFRRAGFLLVVVTNQAGIARGRYTIDDVHLTHDLGRPVNRVVDLGQIEGGLAQGLGWMTLEELAYGEDGRLLSSALSTYKAPDGDFMPAVHIRWVEDDNPHGTVGSKAVGEPPLMYGIGVWFALREAIRAFNPEADVPFRTPMTPEQALLCLYPESAEPE